MRAQDQSIEWDQGKIVRRYLFGTFLGEMCELGRFILAEPLVLLF